MEEIFKASDGAPRYKGNILDSHPLLWWTMDREKLTSSAAEACSRVESRGGLISSISLWELGIRMKNGKLDIGMDIREYTKRIKALGSIEIIPVTEEVWLKNLELDWEHRDPADRTIVATAILQDAELITKDKIIQDFYSRCVRQFSA